ncbi:hypothetical protein B0H16DRAFT_1450719 [Mycena metata]|uniref:Uncharacterized protein n=1 Tax=Mycena metata TaxID=1033252 RepID=A0AAD7JZS7_9AGAR|nr:hypothetical protein B0H16DRAFT_1450719 [Mycena metata]
MSPPGNGQSPCKSRAAPVNQQHRDLRLHFHAVEPQVRSAGNNVLKNQRLPTVGLHSSRWKRSETTTESKRRTRTPLASTGVERELPLGADEHGKSMTRKNINSILWRDRHRTTRLESNEHTLGVIIRYHQQGADHPRPGHIQLIKNAVRPRYTRANHSPTFDKTWMWILSRMKGGKGADSLSSIEVNAFAAEGIKKQLRCERLESNEYPRKPHSKFRDRSPTSKEKCVTVGFYTDDYGGKWGGCGTDRDRVIPTVTAFRPHVALGLSYVGLHGPTLVYPRLHLRSATTRLRGLGYVRLRWVTYGYAPRRIQPSPAYSRIIGTAFGNDSRGSDSIRRPMGVSTPMVYTGRNTPWLRGPERKVWADPPSPVAVIFLFRTFLMSHAVKGYGDLEQLEH